MAHSYSHLYDIPSTGLRFFTVWSWEDQMWPYFSLLTILNGESIKIFNRGEMVRDFTYIDDIIESLFRIIFKIATKDIFNTSMPNPSIVLLLIEFLILAIHNQPL